MFESYKNFGVIEGKRDTDWLGGTLPYEERNPSGDWTPYLPPGEWQTNHTTDTMACVTFSALNSIEVQHILLTGAHREFADRFTAKMSGTTTNGNYLWKVADSIRKDGLVNEIVWPKPIEYTWDTYYEEIPQFIKVKGLEFLTEFDVAYEWIDFTRESLIHHLKHAPIQVTIPGHAVLAFWSTQQVTRFFDSYEPWIKERTESFGSALKIVLTRKTKVMTEQEVKGLYALAFYRLPDAGELSYWVGKDLATFLKTAIDDRANFLQNS